VTNHGAGLRLNGLIMVPSEFGISFDNFRTMRRCRLIWRDGDFVGASFQRGEQCRLRSQGSDLLCCGCWRWHAAEPACICWAGLNRILMPRLARLVRRPVHSVQAYLDPPAP
jgi:hypothetical protein